MLQSIDYYFKEFQQRAWKKTWKNFTEVEKTFTKEIFMAGFLTGIKSYQEGWDHGDPDDFDDWVLQIEELHALFDDSLREKELRF